MSVEFYLKNKNINDSTSYNDISSKNRDSYNIKKGGGGSKRKKINLKNYFLKEKEPNNLPPIKIKNLLLNSDVNHNKIFLNDLYTFNQCYSNKNKRKVKDNLSDKNILINQMNNEKNQNAKNYKKKIKKNHNLSMDFINKKIDNLEIRDMINEKTSKKNNKEVKNFDEKFFKEFSIRKTRYKKQISLENKINNNIINNYLKYIHKNKDKSFIQKYQSINKSVFDGIKNSNKNILEHKKHLSKTMRENIENKKKDIVIIRKIKNKCMSNIEDLNNINESKGKELIDIHKIKEKEDLENYDINKIKLKMNELFNISKINILKKEKHKNKKSKRYLDVSTQTSPYDFKYNFFLNNPNH